MRHALLFSLALALPLQAQRSAPAGIARSAQTIADTLPRHSQPAVRSHNRAVLIESAAGIGGALFGVLYMGSGGCNDTVYPAGGGAVIETSINHDCSSDRLVGIAVVGPIAAALTTTVARSVTDTPGSALASWGGALLGTVIGAGGSVLLTRAIPGADPGVAAVTMMVLGQGTFAALAGRKPEADK